jgi:hypothetical protein
MMRALIVKEPWVSMILKGEKTWEIRGSNSLIRERIGLIRGGSGQVVGTVELVDSIGPLSRDELLANEDKHRVPPSRVRSIAYKNVYAWVLKNPRALRRPISYAHPPGAQMWVKVPDIHEDRA